MDASIICLLKIGQNFAKQPDEVKRNSTVDEIEKIEIMK